MGIGPDLSSHLAAGRPKKTGRKADQLGPGAQTRAYPVQSLNRNCPKITGGAFASPFFSYIIKRTLIINIKTGEKNNERDDFKLAVSQVKNKAGKNFCFTNL